MALTAFRIVVGITPTLLVQGDSGSLIVFIKNASGGSCFIGDSTVSPATGFELQNNQVLGPITVKISNQLYAVRTAGSGEVQILGEGL